MINQVFTYFSALNAQHDEVNFMMKLISTSTTTTALRKMINSFLDLEYT